MPIVTSKENFKSIIRGTESLELTKLFVYSETVYVFSSTTIYDDFKRKVKLLIPESENIYIVGSGNWRYSLNPNKDFSEFNIHSDIDVACVSKSMFNETWECIREIHRKCWYTFDYENKTRIRRNGENIYSGFVSPKWIPITGHPIRYNFKRMLENISGPEVGYKTVNMYYFKNDNELLDYYNRGFIAARKDL